MGVRSVVAVGVLVVGMLGASVPPAAALEVPPDGFPPLYDGPIEDTITDIDDSDRTAWTYVGEWTHASGESWTHGEFDDSESFSRAAGSRATLQFFGTGIQLFGPRGSNGGHFRVWVDCGPPVEGNSYAPSKELMQPLISLDGLQRGQHTVVVEVLGTRDPVSADRFVMIDFARTIDRADESDPRVRWMGEYSDIPVSGPVELRRPGCGSQSDLVDQLAARTTGGWFAVDGNEVWGAVNGHSAELEGGRAAPGPVLIGGVVREAATVGLPAGRAVTLALSLPDRPRSLVLSVAADETVGDPAQFAVAAGDGTFLPMTVVRGGPDEWSVEHSGEAVSLEPGQETRVLVDLRDAAGAGVHPEATLWSRSASGGPAELVILEGRVSDLSVNRLVRQIAPSAALIDPERLAAPPSAFAYGPVVLSRVLADSDQPAWTGNQNSTPGDAATPVPLQFGTLDSGGEPTVDGEVLPADTISLTLPDPGWPHSESSVHLRLQTDKRCRTLTASVGIDDSTPSRDSASVRVEVFGDGEPLTLRHNGLWDHVDYPGAPDSPVIDGFARETLAEQLREVQLAHATALPESSRAAHLALANAQANALLATTADPSMALTTFPLEGALVLGQGFTGNRADAVFASSDSPTDPFGRLREYSDASPISATALYPLAVDLASANGLRILRMAATGVNVGVQQVDSPLVRTVDVVLSGTPGAVVDIASAGLDCVSTAPAADGTPAPVQAMPKWSQVGVPPIFLPSPRDADGEAAWELGANPIWWDIACPNGPSVAGLQYTATRTRISSYIRPGELGIIGTEVIRVDETSTASQPACGFPGDQLASRFGEFAPRDDSPPPPFASDYVWAFSHTTDPLADRLVGIDGSWSDQLKTWATNAAFETLDDPVTFAIWAALAPFDLPGALAFNPFTQHALPMSVQVAVGAVFFEFGAAGHSAAGIPAASGLPAAASRAIESTNELLLMTSEQAHAEVASGEGAILDVGGGELVIPLKPGEAEPVADVRIHGSSRPLVLSDSVTSRLPVTNRGASWIEEADVAEAPRVCARTLNNGCPIPGSPDTWPPEHRNPDAVQLDEEAPDFPNAEPPAPPVIVPLDPPGHIGGNPHNLPQVGYWARYPGAPVSSAVRNADATWPTARAWAAWDETRRLTGEMVVRLMDDTSVLDAEGAYASLPGLPELGRVAVSTDSEPLYLYGTLGPNDVLHPESAGISVTREALNAFEDSNAGLNLADAVVDDNPDQILYVLATRDPDLLAASGPHFQELGHWRIRIDRPAGGGIDVRATLAQADAPAMYQVLANHPELLQTGYVAFPAGVPRSMITRMDRLEFNPATSRFEVVQSFYRPEGPRIPPTEAELAGASVAGSPHHAWAQFDWMLDPVTITIESGPPPEFFEVVREVPGSRIVFTKHEGWTLFAPSFGLSSHTLVRDGFTVGSWGDEPIPVWIPRNRPPNVTVYVDGPWELYQP